MNASAIKLLHGLLFFFVNTIALTICQSKVIAIQPNPEVSKIAQSITVRIDSKTQGTGVLIQHQDDTYTVLSAQHVVKNLDRYTVQTPDGKRHPVLYNTIKPFPGVDLATLQFRSSQPYAIAQIGHSTQIPKGMPFSISGYAATGEHSAVTYHFRNGRLEAAATRPLEKGYSLAYFQTTYPGMSGGPVLDAQGRLIGIQGLSLVPRVATRGINPWDGLIDRLYLAIPINTFLNLVPQVDKTLQFPTAVPTNLNQSLNADDAFLQGTVHSALGHQTEALEAYDQAIRLDPNFAIAYYERGNIQADLNHPQEAIADYTKAITRNPNYPLTYLNRGRVYSDVGNWSMAIADYTEAIRRHPSLAVAYNNRGTVWYQLSDLPRAIADYTKAIGINPKFADAYNNRGLAYAQLGDLTQAIADYDQAMLIDPKRTVFSKNRALVAMQKKRDSGGNKPQTAIALHKLKIVGSTLFSAKDLASITPTLDKQAVMLADLHQVAEAITQRYGQLGFGTSRAIVPKQTIQNGVAMIQVIEGWLGDIKVQGNRTLQSHYIENRLRLSKDRPLNLQQLEAQIRLLESDPLFESVKASLRAGERPGESVLMVKVKEAAPLSTVLSTDNYGSSTGTSENTKIFVSYQNPTGLGDKLSFSSALEPNSHDFRPDVRRNYEVAYRVPVNARNGELELRTAYHDSALNDAVATSLGIRSQSRSYGLMFRQPLIQSLREELELSLGLTAQRSQTFLFGTIPFAFGPGADAQGVTQTRVLEFGQAYTRRDSKGTWTASSQLNLGLGILGATSHAGDAPDGQFVSWQLQGQRLQHLGQGNVLMVQGELQLSPHALLSDQQFNIGGRQSIRGFRPNVRSGDNGWRLSAEGRFPVVRAKSKRPILQLAPFVEAGGVWNADQNPSGAVEEGFLAGAGLGVVWQPRSDLEIRLDYGVPLVNLPDRSNGFQDSGFYFSIISRP